MKVLPKPYWIPKKHSSAIRTRFINASKQCIIELLSENITAAFKLLFKPFEKYHSKSRSHSGVNSFLVIQSYFYHFQIAQFFRKRFSKIFIVL